jgi:hypothetical protein
MNKKGRPWFIPYNKPAPWVNFRIFYFLLCCFFKRSSIASSRMALVGLFLSTAKCFSFTMRSGLRRVVKLSRETSFLVFIIGIINPCFKEVNIFLLTIIKDLMYY